MKYLKDLFTEFQEKCLKSLIIPSFVISAIQELTFAANPEFTNKKFNWSIMRNLVKVYHMSHQFENALY